MSYRLSFYRLLPLVVTILLLLGAALPAHAIAHSAPLPVVHALLFFSPTCGHCHLVMTETLPPLREKYGQQLMIIEINATEEEGQALFRTALEQYAVSGDRFGVPALFIGEAHLVGSREIPEQLPGLIEAGLADSGIALPVIPGLADYLEIYQPEALVSQEEQTPERAQFIDKFLQDPVANGIAVLVLLGMVASVITVGVTFLRATDEVTPAALPDWIVPALCVIGLGIAGYLSFIEITQGQPVCGPVGDCSSVQSSPYAKLLGVLHVGVLGVIGYLAILAAWLVRRFGPPALARYATLALWGLAVIGLLFAIYLTFLEPFVIGATCAWCIGNSIVITLLALVTTKPALLAMQELSAGEED